MTPQQRRVALREAALEHLPVLLVGLMSDDDLAEREAAPLRVTADLHDLAIVDLLVRHEGELGAPARRRWRSGAELEVGGWKISMLGPEPEKGLTVLRSGRSLTVVVTNLAPHPRRFVGCLETRAL